MTMPPSFTRGMFTLALEQKVKTLGVKPTAWQCPRVYSGDAYHNSRAKGQNPRRKADGIAMLSQEGFVQSAVH